jgi:hypothetical protein
MSRNVKKDTTTDNSKKGARAVTDNRSTDNQEEPVATDLDKLKSVLEQRRRMRQQDEVEDKPAPPPQVSLGPAGAIVDALINTSPEKMLELTDFDRNQVSLVPQVVVIDDMWEYLEKLMLYRSDRDQYHKIHKNKYPEVVATSRKLVQVLAQTRRSLGGKMKKALEDMALAELETKSMDDGVGGGHDFED